MGRRRYLLMMQADAHIAIERILVAADDSAAAVAATAAAARLARQVGAKLAIVHVAPDPTGVAGRFLAVPNREQIEQLSLGRQFLTELRWSDARDRFTATFLRQGVVDVQILAVAREWQANLIVLGSRRRGRLAEFVFGSTTQAVLRGAPCPVLVVTDRDRAVAEDPSFDVGSLAAATRAGFRADH